MRRDRHGRLRAQMEQQDVGAALLLGNSAVRYATGAATMTADVGQASHERPVALLIAGDEQPHLFTPFPEGAPPELPADHVHPPLYVELDAGVDILVTRLHDLVGSSIPKLAIDEYSAAMFFGLRARLGDTTALVDAGSLIGAAMRAAREVKTADEIECIRTAVVLSEACLAAAIGAIRPGVSGRVLLGAFGTRMAGLGVTTPAREGTFCATARGAEGFRQRRLTDDVAVNDGDFVACSSGVLYAGYEGTVGRTWPCLSAGRAAPPAQQALFGRWRELWEAVAESLRPGASGADVRKAYEATGEQLPSFPMARGLGLGYEVPVIGTGLDAAADAVWTLVPGMTLVVGAYVWEEGAGGFLGEEVVLITDDGHEVLTRLSHGPLAEEP